MASASQKCSYRPLILIAISYVRNFRPGAGRALSAMYTATHNMIPMGSENGGLTPSRDQCLLGKRMRVTR